MLRRVPLLVAEFVQDWIIDQVAAPQPSVCHSVRGIEVDLAVKELPLGGLVTVHEVVKRQFEAAAMSVATVAHFEAVHRLKHNSPSSAA
jgi:hypothetical protein